MVSQDDRMKKATQENRMITRTEGRMRRNGGCGIFVFTSGLLAILPSSRNAYGPISALYGAAALIWMTGRLSLWGCAIKLTWKLDGKGSTAVPPEYRAYMMSKRKEFLYSMGVTQIGVIGAAFVVAFLRNDATREILSSILLCNFAAALPTIGISYLS